MWQFILYFYGYAVFVYSMVLIISFVLLLIFAYQYSMEHKQWTDNYKRQTVQNTPYAPGVSMVIPAHNEIQNARKGIKKKDDNVDNNAGDGAESNLIDNIRSFLSMDYPNFEVCVVNDGSDDETLQVLKDTFNLVKVPYDYVPRIHSAPFRGLYKSIDPKYSNLIVVDKVNGGTKADAVNAGLNVISNPYFINTDADCKLAKDSMYQCLFPVLMDERIIAVSGAMYIHNGFKFDPETKLITGRNAPYFDTPFALWQDLEYKRSFLVGKMGWSKINAMNNVSGGYGFFSTEVVVNAGGYSNDSFAEDMDMITRMIAYCCDTNRDYRVVQIPHACCWTDGAEGFSLLKQRKRWGYGLIQTLWVHRHTIFNPKYHRLGLITMPYTFFFEFLAPIIEVVGWIVMIYLGITGGINWSTFWLTFLAVYLFGILLSSFVIFYDYILGCSYDSKWSYVRLFIAALLEPLYHIIVTGSSLWGYYSFITARDFSWGEIKRNTK